MGVTHRRTARAKPTEELRNRWCDECDNKYQGTKFSHYCPVCKIKRKEEYLNELRKNRRNKREAKQKP